MSGGTALVLVMQCCASILCVKQLSATSRVERHTLQKQPLAAIVTLSSWHCQATPYVA